jgi:DNA repair protein RecO (recombination protein O)
MIQTTRGIVIQTLRYNDNKLIVKVLCERFGLKSGIVYAGKSKKNGPTHLFHPLAIIEFESDFQEVNKFIPIKSARLSTPLHHIATDPSKTAMILFMNEVLAKTIADDYVNDILFGFLRNSVQLLDDAIDVRNFHVWWLLEITRHYGFYPQQPEPPSEALYFDMLNGSFVRQIPKHPHYLETTVSGKLVPLLDLEWPQVQSLEMHSSIRSALLHGLVTFLKLHLENLREIKSLDVLHAVFH